MMIAFLTTVISLVQDPIAKWQVPFYPVEQAALNMNGLIMLSTKRELYIYDREGNLEVNAAIEHAPDLIFSDPQQQFWVHDESGVLRCWTSDLMPIWSVRRSRAVFEPFAFQSLVAYSTDASVYLIDPSTGQSRHAMLLESGLAGVQPLGHRLLVADRNGDNQIWDGRKRELDFRRTSPFEGRSVKFICSGPNRDIAVVFADRVLEVFRPDWTSRWKRSYPVDIDLRPIWIGTPKQPRLAIATQGRSLHIYRRNGQEYFRLNLSDRPQALARLNDESLLVTYRENPVAVWLDAESKTTHIQQLSSYVTHLLQNHNTVLLIGYDGQVTAYLTDRGQLDFPKELAPH